MCGKAVYVKIVLWKQSTFLCAKSCEDFFVKYLIECDLSWSFHKAMLVDVVAFSHKDVKNQFNQTRLVDIRSFTRIYQ